MNFFKKKDTFLITVSVKELNAAGTAFVNKLAGALAPVAEGQQLNLTLQEGEDMNITALSVLAMTANHCHVKGAAVNLRCDAGLESLIERSGLGRLFNTITVQPGGPS